MIQFPQGILHFRNTSSRDLHGFTEPDDLVHLPLHVFQHMLKTVYIPVGALDQLGLFTQLFDLGVHIPNEDIESPGILVGLFNKTPLLLQAFDFMVNMLAQEVKFFQLAFQVAVVGFQIFGNALKIANTNVKGFYFFNTIIKGIKSLQGLRNL